MKTTLIVMLVLIGETLYSQYYNKLPRVFDKPILIDSTGIFLIPIVYQTNVKNESSSVFGDGYCANIFISTPDSTKTRTVFEEDTYIYPLLETGDFYTKFERYTYKSISKNNIFLLVKNVDFNLNNRIDSHDPAILYVTDLNAKGLTRLTPENVNVKEYFINEKKNQIIVKVQIDENNNKRFNSKDEKFMLIQYDLQSMQELKRISL